MGKGGQSGACLIKGAKHCISRNLSYVKVAGNGFVSSFRLAVFANLNIQLKQRQRASHFPLSFSSIYCICRAATSFLILLSRGNGDEHKSDDSRKARFLPFYCSTTQRQLNMSLKRNSTQTNTADRFPLQNFYISVFHGCEFLSLMFYAK